MKYKQYQKYKDSGVEWIGEIPEEWEVRRLKFACKINPPKSEIQNVSDEELVSFLPMELVSEEGTLQLDQNKRKDEVYDGFTYFRNGDVIVAKITPCFENGKGAFCENLKNGIGFGSTEFHVLRVLDGFDSKFIYNLTRSFPFKKMGEAMMYGAAGQKRVPTDFIENFVFPYPKKNEDAKAISEFIEKQTNDFNYLISKSQSQIKLLQEKRHALINHAVTKGLDLSVTMKDSGVEWIGEIPEHWEVKRLKYLSKIELSSVDRHTKDNEQKVLVCHYPDVYNNEKITSDTSLNSGTCTIQEFEKFKLKKDDVLITKDSETADDIGVPTYVTDDLERTVCGYHIAQITTDKTKLLGGFLFRFIQTDKTSGYFEAYTNGITRYGMRTSVTENLFIPYPKKEEQKQIENFLDKETKQFDDLISKSQSQINFLQEKRQALITSAVTGKIDVRNGVAA